MEGKELFDQCVKDAIEYGKDYMSRPFDKGETVTTEQFRLAVKMYFVRGGK